MPTQKAPQTFNEQFEEIAHRFPDRVAFPSENSSRVHDRPLSRRLLPGHFCRMGPSRFGHQTRQPCGHSFGKSPGMGRGHISDFILPAWLPFPLDTQISPAEWRRLLDDSEVHVVFVSGLLLSKLQEAVQDSRPPRRIISFDPVAGDRDARTELAGLIDWAAGVARSSRLPNAGRRISPRSSIPREPPALPKASC